MSGRSKGFDPLSNLFTDAAAVPAAPAGDDSDPSAVGSAADLVDPASVPALTAPSLEAPEPVDKAALAKRLAEEAQARIPEAPALDKAALAKKLAADAQAKAGAEPAPAATPPTATQTPEDKALLAKALAKAAIAKSGAAAKPAAPAKAKKSLAERAPRSLSDRAGGGRRMSALEAARAAAAEEAARKQASAVAKRSTLATSPGRASAPAGSSGLLGGVLGAAIQEEPPRLAQQREVLSALWKAHTQRHIQDKRWSVAGGCAAVVDALDRLGPGQLAAVPATAGEADLLVWVDLTRRAIVAVIPDGRTYLSGL